MIFLKAEGAISVLNLFLFLNLFLMALLLMQILMETRKAKTMMIIQI